MMSQNEDFKNKPAIMPLAHLVIELLTERGISVKTNNTNYRALYMKIDNKFRHSVDFVDEEIRRRRDLT